MKQILSKNNHIIGDEKYYCEFILLFMFFDLFAGRYGKGMCVLDCKARVEKFHSFCCSRKNFYCYGAGDIAFYVALYLYVQEIVPYAFVVSAGEHKPLRYLGRPVYEFSKLPEPRNDDGIVFALREETAKKIFESLSENWKSRTFIVEQALLLDIKQALQSWVCGVPDGLQALCELTGVPQTVLEPIFVDTVQRSSAEFLWRASQMTRRTTMGCFFAQKALLGNAARYEPQELMQWLPWNALRIADTASFLSMYEEIFVRQIYAFDWPEDEAGVILDLGANIGLSVLFFARSYPQAQIEAYEADPAIFEILRWNVEHAGTSSVVLYNQAVWKENSVLQFRQEGADAGSVVRKESGGICVKARDICDILRRHERVAFLKMDIEGSEREVLARAQQELLRVDRIFVEYHGAADETPWLSEVLGILEDSDFRIALHADNMAALQPLKEIQGMGSYELQVNIFGIRISGEKSEREKQ